MKTTFKKDSALAKYADNIMREAYEENKIKFPTYMDALVGIRYLQEENYRLRLSNAILSHKRGKGRPKEQLKIKTFSDLFRLGSPVSKKKGGRRAEITIEKMKEKLKEWDAYRESLLPILSGPHIIKRHRVKTITDKRAVEYIILSDRATQGTAAGLTPQENKIAETFLDKISYYRDQTGIYTRSRNKRKTS